MSENKVSYTQTMSDNYVDYAMSVIVARALPSVLDGLKPVQRRNIYAISQLTKSDGAFRKCARVVGDTMGKYHPHGDASIYESLVNLAQDFKLPIPLVTGHGNFGSVDETSAAAMRYTEAKISKYTEDVCLSDLPYLKDLMVPNFDETESEPSVLPFQVPNLLTSGTKGIAVGMDSTIPTHNLSEVIDAFILYMKNKDVSIDELMDVFHGPDFATGGIINSTKENIKSIYESGTGKVMVRGKVEIRDAGYGRKSICITEIPPSMIGKTEKFLTDINDLIIKRILPQSIVAIADRGDENGVCLCVDVKKGTSDEEIEKIVNILYKKAGLESSYTINMNAIDKDNAPKLYNLKGIFSDYLEFKQSIYKKKYEKLLQSEEVKVEVKDGLIKAMDVIDLIIEILRGSKDLKMARACLTKGETNGIKFRFKGSEEDAKELRFTDRQVDAIFDYRMKLIVGLEVEALKKELAEAKKNVKRYTELLASESLMQAQMIEDLLRIKKEFAIPRKTKIENLGAVVVAKAEEVVSDVTVLMDRFSYVKVVSRNTFTANEQKINEGYKYVFHTTSDDKIGVFTNKNTYHTVKIMDIVKAQSKLNTAKKGDMFGSVKDKGVQLVSLCGMDSDAEIFLICPITVLAGKQILFASKSGLAKKVNGEAFDISRKVSQLHKEGEEMCFIGIIDGTEVVAKTNGGYYARVSVDEIPERGRTAGGSKLITLSPNDFLESVYVGTNRGEFTITETVGSGINTREEEKTLPFSRIKLVGRGAKGTKIRI